jgi:hypothetical protein
MGRNRVGLTNQHDVDVARLDRRERAAVRPACGRIDDRLAGFFALFSGRPHAYSTRDLIPAGRLAGYVGVALAHQRLAEAARHAAVERERTASIEASVELLRAIADVLDIRTVFPRVSEIANKILPHDRLTMTFQDQDGHIAIEAASTDEFPDLTRIVKTHTIMPEEGFIIFDDFTTTVLPVAEPADLGAAARRLSSMPPC